MRVEAVLKQVCLSKPEHHEASQRTGPLCLMAGVRPVSHDAAGEIINPFICFSTGLHGVHQQSVSSAAGR